MRMSIQMVKCTLGVLGGGALGIGIRETSPGAVCCSEWQCGAA